MSDLDAEGITRLLEALDRELAARGTTADVYLVGGAAMPTSGGCSSRRICRSPSLARVEQDAGDLAMLAEAWGITAADRPGTSRGHAGARATRSVWELRHPFATCVIACGTT